MVTGNLRTSILTSHNWYAYSEADEIYKICSVIGSPTEDSWADGLHLASDINYQFPQVTFVKCFYVPISICRLIDCHYEDSVDACRVHGLEFYVFSSRVMLYISTSQVSYISSYWCNTTCCPLY